MSISIYIYICDILDILGIYGNALFGVGICLQISSVSVETLVICHVKTTKTKILKMPT